MGNCVILIQTLLPKPTQNAQPHADYQEIVSSNNQSVSEEVPLTNTDVYNGFDYTKLKKKVSFQNFDTLNQDQPSPSELQ
jgi:hypothetical protein